MLTGVFLVSPLLTILSSSCKPQMAHSILAEEGMTEALEQKLLISILAGTTMAQLKSWAPPSCRVVRAMPNTPCKVSPSQQPDLHHAITPEGVHLGHDDL